MQETPDDKENAEHPADRESLIPQLTFEEARVLGCLLEKESTTPDHYPLTLNALQSACNQSSNRNPVVDFGTDTVEEAVEGLRYKNLALLVRQAGARVAKIKHTIDLEFPYLTRSQQAILCVLLLRSQQTAGELRQRTERMHAFSDIEALEKQLEALIENKPEPLVRRIPAGSGRRVETFVHLLCGEPAEVEGSPGGTAASATVRAAPGRVEQLETEVESLREALLELRREFEEFRSALGE